jgi:hypothetical protein
MTTMDPLMINIVEDKRKYGSDKEIRKKLVEHTPHRVTFQGVYVFLMEAGHKNNTLNFFPPHMAQMFKIVFVKHGKKIK